MKKARIYVLVLLIALSLTVACGPKEQKAMEEPPVAVAAVAQEAAPAPPAVEPATPPAPPAPPPAPLAKAPVAEVKPAPKAPKIALEVNARKMTQVELDRMIDRQFQAIKANIPKGQEKAARASLRQEIVNDFILRSLLADEADRVKIVASPKEINEAFQRFEATLPPGVTLEEVMKTNMVTREKIREDLALGIRVGQLLEKRTGGTKASDKEILEFYEKNVDIFRVPESTRAKHILVASAKTESEALRKEKRAKAEALRKQLLEGADFAQLAKTNSDCPSKGKGGELGTFTRGQMVRPFEEAAFSQKINEIGPVVETDFGYHIIVVSERTPAKVAPLDEEARQRISAHLQMEKQRLEFTTLIEQLRAKAKIILH